MSKWYLNENDIAVVIYLLYTYLPPWIDLDLLSMHPPVHPRKMSYFHLSYAEHPREITYFHHSHALSGIRSYDLPNKSAN